MGPCLSARLQSRSTGVLDCHGADVHTKDLQRRPRLGGFLPEPNGDITTAAGKIEDSKGSVQPGCGLSQPGPEGVGGQTEGVETGQAFQGTMVLLLMKARLIH